MGKMHDKLKDRMSPYQVVPRAVAGASIIQQLGLDTPMGLQRMLMIMMHKIDPEAKGFHLELDDINAAVNAQLVDGRKNWLVKGEHDRLFFRMCTDEEFKVLRQAEEQKDGPSN